MNSFSNLVVNFDSISALVRIINNRNILHTERSLFVFLYLIEKDEQEEEKSMETDGSGEFRKLFFLGFAY